MRRGSLVWLAMLLLVGGCVSPVGKIPEAHTIARRNVLVVPLEAAPLYVYKPNPALQLLWGTFYPGGVFISGLAIMLGPSQEELRVRSEQVASHEASGAWVPTVPLAEEFELQLNRSGKTTSVRSPHKQMPGIADRKASSAIDAWPPPIRAWFTSDEPVGDYAATPNADETLVLEVGISIYSVQGDRLMLQILVKAIDPANGRVLARALADNSFAMPDLRPFEQTFGNGASRFKLICAETSRPLVSKSLRSLGLLP